MKAQSLRKLNLDALGRIANGLEEEGLFLQDLLPLQNQDLAGVAEAIRQARRGQYAHNFPVPPERFLQARKLMGQSFFSTKDVQLMIGTYNDAELQRRKTLSLIGTEGKPLSEDETMKVLNECRNTHLAMPTVTTSSRNLFAENRSVFHFTGQSPWFMLDKERTVWSKDVMQNSWMLTPVSVPEVSLNRTMAWQQAMATADGCRLMEPVEFLYAAILYKKRFGKRLYNGYRIRFATEDSGAYLSATWDEDKIHFQWFGERVDKQTGIIPIRTSED